MNCNHHAVHKCLTPFSSMTIYVKSYMTCLYSFTRVLLKQRLNIAQRWEKSFHIFSILLTYISYNFKGKTRFRCIKIRRSDNFKPHLTLTLKGKFTDRIHSFVDTHKGEGNSHSIAYNFRYDKTE